MDRFMQSPIIMRVVLFTAPLACLLQIIGMACPNWSADGKLTVGLWQTCNEGACIGYLSVPDFVDAVRAMEVLGTIVLFGAVVFVVLSIFMSTDVPKRIYPILGTVSSFVATIFILIGVIVYVVEMNKLVPPPINFSDYLSWAFGLCITAAILSFIVGVLLILSMVK